VQARVTGLHYRSQGLELRISRVAVDWRPAKLLQRELRISSLQLGTVEAVTRPDPEPDPGPADEPLRLPDVRLPLGIVIEQASLATLSIHDSDAAELFSAKDIFTSASFDGHTLALQRLQADSAGLSLSLAGQVSPTGSYPLSVSGDYSLVREALPQLDGRFVADGDLQRLRIEHQTLAPVATQLIATVTDLLQELAWEARLEVQQFDSGAISPDWEPFTLQASARSQGSLAAYRFEVQTRVSGTRIPAGSWSLDGTGTSESIDIQRLHAQTTAGTLSGRLRLTDLLTTAHWDTALKIEQLDTSRVDPGWEALTLDGSVQSEGTLEDYTFELDAQVQGERIPAGHWLATGSGNTQAVQVQTLRAQTLAGVIAGNLQVQWAPWLEWRFASEATGIDPGLYWPDWPGKVDFVLDGKGARSQGRYRAQVELKRLSGTLAQQPVRASGKLSADHHGFSVSALDIHAAGAHLFASGELTERWTLEWNLDAPDLAALYPAARGSLSGSGELSGPRGNPGLRMKLRGSELGFEQHRAASVLLAIDWTPDDSKPSRLDLQAFDLLLDGKKVAQLDVSGSGLASDHKLKFAVDAEALQLSGRVAGSYSEHNWQGLLSAAKLTLPPRGDWLLQNPAPIQIGRQSGAVSGLCMANRNEGHACAEASWQGDAGWQAELDAQSLPLALLDPLLPEDLSTDGSLRLTAQAHQGPDGTPRAEVEIVSADGAFLYQTVNQDPLRLRYRDFRLTARLEQGLVRLSTRADLDDSGGMNGRLELPVPALNPASRRIDGVFAARLGELGILQALIPGVDEVSGDLALDLAVRGSLEQPDIELDLALKDGQVSLPAQGIILRDIALHAEPRPGGSIAFGGHAASGDGDVDLSGTFTAGGDNGWRANMQLQGERFLAVDVPEYEVLVSPDLKLDMTADAARVSGTVSVPEARLRPRQLSGAARRSRDVVIVTPDQQASAGYAVYSRVRVDLGRHVRFDGFGLKGRFTGSVVVSDAPNQLASGTGELRIAEGSYKAYGQNLKIERGRLILVGGPLDNPGLDVRAIREVGNVTAGLHVTGELQEPTVSVFSDPAMSETEALSYLVLGRPLPQDDSKDREQVNAASAALALGVGGASLLGERFGEQVGIDEVGVETESTTGEITLKLGTYLTPDLFVGYGRGLANQVNSFLVRYRLTRSLSVETESSSEAVGGDLFYSIER